MTTRVRSSINIGDHDLNKKEKDMYGGWSKSTQIATYQATLDKSAGSKWRCQIV